METISIVIPFFNEEESIRELYEDIERVMEGSDHDFEVIFVDDGSTDGSGEIVNALIQSGAPAGLISLRGNFGKAAALQAGFRLCRGEFVITLDADLQDDPSEISKFIDKLHEGYDLVSGWKYKRLDPLEKRLPSKLFNKTVSFLSGIKLHDFNCGFKAYRREVIDAIDLYGELHRFIPVIAGKYGFRIAEVAVNHRPRVHGKSKFGFERYLRGLFDSISVSFLTRYSAKPMYVFGSLGFSVFLVGFILCGILTVEWLGGASISSRPLLLLGVMLIILGVQVCSTGLIADLLVDSMYRSKYNEYHIRETTAPNSKWLKPAKPGNEDEQ